MFEAACEPYNHCDNDQLSFKAYFSRFIAASTKWLPELYPLAQPYLQASAIAAAQQCDGDGAGVEGYACGMKWVDNTTWDGTYGFGQQMCALEVIQANLIQSAASPVSAQSGGISKGDPGAGTAGDTTTGQAPLSAITTGDRAGAGILTAIVLVGILGGTWWMVS